MIVTRYHTYFDRFLEADERTAKFGLSEKKMKKIEIFYSQSHLSSKFEDFLFKVMPMNNLNILSRNCLAVNLALIEKIKGHFQCDASSNGYDHEIQDKQASMVGEENAHPNIQ